ncbi:MAG: fibronectin type III domain-containing protein [Actinomycetes bacterium]
MFESITRRARRIAAVTAAGALVATGFVLPAVTATAASADTLTSSVATVTAVATTPAFTGQTTNGLVAGQSVSIRVDRAGTNNISAIQVRLCKSGSNIASDSDFNPSQGGKCINAPFSGTTNDDSVSADGLPGASPTYAEATFRVGSGVNTFTRQNSQTATITCNATNPCELWVKVSTPANPNLYWHADVTYAGNPGTPTGLGVSVGAGQATLNWTAPVSTGNAPISSYTVTYTPSGGSPVTTSSTTTSKTINGLTNFVNYSFTVKANTIGSFASADTSPATGTPSPTGPTSLGGVPAGGAISLSWTAPTTSGVTDYRVTSTPAGGSPSTALTGSTGVTYTLSGLTNGTQYTVTVAAVYGTGNFTVESNAVNVTPTAAIVGDSFTVVVPNGSLALTTAATGAINLGTAVLDATAKFWESTGNLSAVTVTDTRSGSTGWTLSIVSGNFTSGANSFTGANLGVTPSVTAGYTTDLAPVAGAAVTPRGGSGNNGLSVSRTFASSATGASIGRASFGGALKLSVPTSQAPGTYAGTLTITAL